MADDLRCQECDGRLDRPGLYGCDEEGHPAPHLAQAIVLAVEENLNDRRGLKWHGIAEDVLDDLRDDLAAKVQSVIAQYGVIVPGEA